MFGRRRVVQVVAVALFAGFAARDADAATVSVDVGMKTLVPNGTTAEPTFGLRVGHELDLKVARFVPEVGLVGIPETSFFGGIAGGRFSFLRLIEPGVYAHLGYGGILGETGGLTYDGGLQLDLVVSRLRAGVHMGAELDGGDGTSSPFFVAGLHTGVRF
jgi:hypothetical protein